MPPKKGSPKKKKMKEIDPAEMFYLEKVQPNKSVLSRSRLPDECSLEVDEFAPQYDARPGIAPNGDKIHWLGLKHRTEQMLEDNMLPAVPPLNRATIDRCWLAIRMNWQPARVGASEHACRSTDLLGFLNQRGENIPNDMSDLGKVTWRPLQRLIEKHFHIQQPGGFIYAHRKAPLAVEEGGVDFYEACAQGEEKDVDDVRSLLSSPIGADAVNTPSAGKGEYPLAIAAQNGKMEVAFELLQRTPVLIAADTAGNTALHYAASGGHLRLAEMLIDAGASIDNENAYGETPLHFACRSSRPEVANLLLDKGAEVSAEFKKDYVKRASRAGFTALHYSAAAPEMGQITTLLLVEGQYAYRAFDVRTNFGQTPLERAAKANRHDSVMAISKWPGPEDPNAKKKKPGTSPGKKRR